MSKKRLIFTLLYKTGKFCLSRNFRNQFIGDLHWLFQNYNFGYVSRYIDELIILNVEEERKDQDLFIDNIKGILKNVFVPVAIGGGIRSAEDAKNYFEAGADKIVLNTVLRTSKKVVAEIESIYGAQAIIASVDYKKDSNLAYIENGKTALDIPLMEYLKEIQELGIGEILLNSIEKDGTGFGFDLETIAEAGEIIEAPLIVAGGAGKKEHFFEVAQMSEVDAFSTANLLNFIGEALPNARRFLLERGVNLANFQLD